MTYQTKLLWGHARLWPLVNPMNGYSKEPLHFLSTHCVRKYLGDPFLTQLQAKSANLNYKYECTMDHEL